MGEERPGGHVPETGPPFEASDGQLDAGLASWHWDDGDFECRYFPRQGGTFRGLPCP
jgi:hypothetical protein